MDFNNLNTVHDVPSLPVHYVVKVKLIHATVWYNVNIDNELIIIIITIFIHTLCRITRVHCNKVYQLK